MPRSHDRDAIRAVLNRDRPWSVYALGDLDPEYFPHTRWHVVPDGSALVMLYVEFQPAVVFALGHSQALELLLEEVGETELYLHVRPEVVPLLRARYQEVHEQPMWRKLLDTARFAPVPTSAKRLTASDVPALERLYDDGDAAGERPHFFLPSMVERGVFTGIYEGADLIAVAGTHLVSAAEGVAAVGNIYTRRDRRGRGLAAQTTAAVVGELLRREIGTIILNVSQTNGVAERVYERLGFRRYCAYDEGSVARRRQGEKR